MSTILTSPAARILMPGDPGWDDARRAWNLAVDQHPAAVALPASVQDVVDAVRFARARGLRVAAQGSGHNAAVLGSLDGTMLVRSAAMRRVTIDSSTKIACVEAGAVSRDLVESAAEHGMAALVGTSADVGLMGYTTGGGISWLSRAYGLAANNVEAIEVVTADGRLVRADASTETDLFWALRGGGGSFGVVTAVELRLLPITEVYAGQLWWPAEAASPVLQAWRELAEADPPDEFTSVGRLMNFPDIPGIPDQLRGGSFVIVMVSHLGAPAEADALLAPLRALRPVTDTIQTIPIRTLSQLHMDPEQPTPSVSDASLLASLPAEAIETFIRVAGPESGTRIVWAEMSQLGGEMKRVRPGSGALAAIDARYQLAAGGRAPAPQAVPEVEHSVAALHAAMRPWAARQRYLNTAETIGDPAGFWTPEAYDRLCRIKAEVDPDDLIRSNHPVPPHQGG
jgi:FAD/FMN-containing dehydrogenase